jgi:hypothetical protein
VKTVLALLAALVLTAWPARAFAGYTHYWTWLVKPDPARLKVCLDDMEKLLRARPDIVADGNEVTGPDAKFRTILPATPKDDEEKKAFDEYLARAREAGLPDVIEGEHVVFNGIGDNGHETFIFPNDLGWNFCKTAYKPYDEVVTAALLVARTHFSPQELEIASDGEWGDWTAGRRLYEKTFGKEPPNPLLSPEEAARPPDKRRNLIISGVLLGLGIVAWLFTRARRAI